MPPAQTSLRPETLRLRPCGLHSLVNVSGGTFALPPLAKVTLESVQEAGAWEVRGLRVQRRLFIVRVSFRERA